MANSLVIDWLNENALRAYPLKELINRVGGAYTLTDDVILDAQFVYTTLPGNVQLLNITSDAVNVTFTITGGDTFVVPKASSFPLSVRNANGNLLTVGEATAAIPNGVYNFSNTSFEDGISHEFSGSWLGVSSLQFNSSPLKTGTLNFVEGYQFGINITGSNIFLGCGKSYGLPVGCETFGPQTNDCNDIVSYINGDKPSSEQIRFSNGGGIVILEDPDNNRLFIGLASNPAEDVCKNIPSNPSQLTL